ncbi:hypothetical protein [Nocardioides sp. KR10-350]|uniref:hypothetical protein n=1 Tax=Nocardioides cheoyonin TaxID=3156615 RepID=UPI0032B5A76C
MDDEQVLRARQVAVAASAWFHARSDSEAYRRLLLASAQWVTYRAPRLDEPASDELAAHLRRAARLALDVMDDDAAQLATNVADASVAWLGPSGDGAAYDHFENKVAEWDNYCTPPLPEPAVEELLDELGEDRAPVALREAIEVVTAQLHGAVPEPR